MSNKKNNRDEFLSKAEEDDDVILEEEILEEEIPMDEMPEDEPMEEVAEDEIPVDDAGSVQASIDAYTESVSTGGDIHDALATLIASLQNVLDGGQNLDSPALPGEDAPLTQYHDMM